MAGSDSSVLVIGGGPAGLRAAEVACSAGANVILCEGKRSVGRKFLVAGRGGLNLTHSESVENFPERYGSEPERWRDLLREFSPEDLREWAAGLGVETYVGTSGRVFPRGQKAAGLLRAWVRALRSAGVEFRTGVRLSGVVPEAGAWRAEFVKEGEATVVTARAVVLALGGASWPETGSDGTWPALLAAHGVEVTLWAPANCGWEVDWPAPFLACAEGMPLKNLLVSAGGESISGELLITRYGLEGGAIYRLGRILRAMDHPEILLDLKPQLSVEALRDRLAKRSTTLGWSSALNLS
ncbi:MAG: TIGR03862 family flavoprotein, partial [Chthoniobacterales bacterium]|nr:TIGR03862 family flavoprotein [Chthoniobacterales bacterium]